METLSIEEMGGRATPEIAVLPSAQKNTRDPRLPPPDSVLQRQFGYRTYYIQVLEQGFIWGSNTYSNQVAMMHYDAAADAVVVFRHTGPADECGVFVYDPSSNAWTTATKKMPKLIGYTRNGFYHPEWNAHVIHSATDGRTDGKIYIYRYRRRPKTEAD